MSKVTALPRRSASTVYITDPAYYLVRSHNGVGMENMTTLSTGVITAGRAVLNNIGKFLVLGEHHCLETMQQLHIGGNLGWIQPHTMARFILRQAMIAISKAEWIQMRKVSNKLIGIMRLSSLFTEVIKTILNHTTAYERENTKTFTATQVLHIVSDMMGSDFSKGIIDQSFF